MDDLNHYFNQLAEHELFTPEYEADLSRRLTECEISAWEHLLIQADAPAVVEIVKSTLEEGVKLRTTAWSTAFAAATPKGRRDPKIMKKLKRAARSVAEQIRNIDLDRVIITKIRTELAPNDDKLAKILAEVVELRNEFVQANLRLVVKMAKRYSHPGMTLSDLIQEGSLGLMHAISRFEPDRGLRFSTYACWWIRHAINRALADKGRAVRIPVHMLEAQQLITKKRQQLIGELGRVPTIEEMATATDIEIEKLNEMNHFIIGASTSLDRPVHDEDNRTLGDTLADPDTDDEPAEYSMNLSTLVEQLPELLSNLSPIEADVLRQRFGIGDDEEKTFREIGEQYQLSRERIRQIQKIALDKLRMAVERKHRGQIEL